MPRNHPFSMLTKASLEKRPWLCQDLRNMKMVGKFLRDLKRNSIFLSEASLLIKREKKCNLICMTFCQLSFILLLLFIFLLERFRLLSVWTKAWRTLSSIACDLPSGVGKLHLFIFVNLGTEGIVMPLNFVEIVESFYIKSWTIFKLQRAAGRNLSGTGEGIRVGLGRQLVPLSFHGSLLFRVQSWLHVRLLGLCFLSTLADSSSSNSFADPPSLIWHWNAGILQSSTSTLFSFCMTCGVSFPLRRFQPSFQIAIRHLCLRARYVP